MNSIYSEHLSRCKEKALTELDEEQPEHISQILQTLLNELRNDSKTKCHPLIAIISLEISCRLITTKDELLKFLVRFD